MKKLFLAFALFTLVTITVAACSSSSSTVAPNAPNTVHMSDSNFVQPSITIQKGSKLTIVDDTGTPHIITNGSWVNGSSQLAKESGAPAIQVQFGGNDAQAVGTFNTAGTYHLLCTIHQNMNLTVIVQ